MTAATDDVCRYSAAHSWRGVPAAGTIDCGPVGPVRACSTCIAFYERMAQK